MAIGQASTEHMSAMLELDRVVRHYHAAGEEVRAVDGVSLTLNPGEMVALHGPSGSGKTTLLLLTAALLRPQRGRIRFRGKNIGSFSERQASEYLMRDVGFIYQRFKLMPRVSALENAAMHLVLGGMKLTEARELALPWLQRLGLGELVDRTPELLSGGERQRVAIARALAGGPRLVLADEPTGSLDSQRSREVIGLLHDTTRETGCSVLLVTHDLEAAGVADRRMTLRDGRLTEFHTSREATRGAAASHTDLPLDR